MCSRIDWLGHGDANTKYFHLSVLNRRRRNKITYFKDSNDIWITDPAEIANYVHNYFSACFTTDHITLDWSYLK